MKKLFFLINTAVLLLITVLSFAQTPPEGINYQAIARDTTGKAMSNTNVVVKFTIWDAATGGNMLFTETQPPVNTNKYGLFTRVIGSVQNSSFQNIPWEAGDKYLEVELSTTGGSTYISMGRTQMMSVPYALYAKNAGSGWKLEGNTVADSNYIGTNNAKDWVIKTNSLERIRVTSTGNIGIGNIIPYARLDVQGAGNNFGSFGFGVRNSLNQYSMAVRDDGNIGIGTIVPTARLDVKGKGADLATYGLKVSDSSGTNVLLSVRDDGAVGIGTTNPGARLEVAGRVKITGGSPGLGKVLTSDATGLAHWDTTVTAYTGTVTSFSAGDLSPLFTSTVTNASSTPNLAFHLTNTPGANQILGNNTGAPAIPFYFTPVLSSPLFHDQGLPGNPSLTYVLRGAGSSGAYPLWGQIENTDIANSTIDLAAKVAGILSYHNGGTGASTIGVQGSVVYSNGSVYGYTLQGAAGQVLTSTGAGAPTWGAANAYLAGTGLLLSGNTFNSVWTINGNDIYNNNLGNIGIGTGSSAVGGRLDVAGGFFAMDNGDFAGNRGLKFRNAADGTGVPNGGGIFQANNDIVYLAASTPNIITFRQSGGVTDALAFQLGSNPKIYTFGTQRLDLIANSATLSIGGVTGKTGIGLNAPASVLHVAGQISAGIPFGGLGGALATNGSLLFYNAGNTNTVTINSGATLHNYTITLPTDSAAGPSVLLNNGFGALSWAAAWLITGNAGTLPPLGLITSPITSGKNFIGTTDGTDFVIATSNLERMRVLSTGNIGIGTKTPTAKLDVQNNASSGAAGSFQNLNGTNTSDVMQINSNAKGKALNINVNNTSNATDALYIGTNGNGSKGLTISNTGGTATANYGSYISATGANSGAGTNVGGYFTAANAGHNYAAIFDQGYVGIGTTTPKNILDVNGSLAIGAAYAGIKTAPSNSAIIQGSVVIGDTIASTYTKLAIKDGHLQSKQTNPPTSFSSTGGYTGSLSNATDVAGKITIIPAVATGSVTFSFDKSYVAPIIIITPTNVAAAGQIANVYVTTSTSTFTINFTFSSNTNPHTYNYQVIETQ
jgi:hypothetical protein